LIKRKWKRKKRRRRKRMMKGLVEMKRESRSTGERVRSFARALLRNRCTFVT
jgi:hypothetical protein